METLKGTVVEHKKKMPKINSEPVTVERKQENELLTTRTLTGTEQD